MPVRHSFPAATLGSILLLGTIACGRGGPPPFALFGRDDMRPGIDFTVLDEAARAEQDQPWACKAIWSGARSCWLRVDSGMLTAIVDDGGRVVRLIYVTDESLRGPRQAGAFNTDKRAVLENYIDAMRMTWDSIIPHRTGPTNRGIAEYRWIDSTGRWSAGLWYSPITRYIPASWELSHRVLRDTLAYVPDSIAVTNEPAYSALLDKRPPAAIGVTAGAKLLPGRPLTVGEQFEIMRTDLAMLGDAQEEYRSDSSRYAVNLRDLMFLEREGVVIEMLEATPSGWGARATHTAVPEASCVLHGGRVKSKPRTRFAALESRSNEVVCDGVPYSPVASR